VVEAEAEVIKQAVMAALVGEQEIQTAQAVVQAHQAKEIAVEMVIIQITQVAEAVAQVLLE
jgi:hypothetical protein